MKTLEEIKKELQEIKLLLMQLPDEYRLTRTVGKLGLEHLENVLGLLESTISQTKQELIEEMEFNYGCRACMDNKKILEKLSNK